MLARAATGSFRDALGTLEQLVTYGGTEIKLDDVLEILGVADAELVLETADSLVSHDPRPRCWPSSDWPAGRDITQFMRDLAAHLRHLYVVQTLGEVPEPVLRHRGAHRPARVAGRVAGAGRGAAGDRAARRRAVRGQGRVGPADPARAGAAEGGPAAGRPVAAGAAVRIEQLEARVPRTPRAGHEAPPTAQPARAAAAGGGGPPSLPWLSRARVRRLRAVRGRRGGRCAQRGACRRSRAPARRRWRDGRTGAGRAGSQMPPPSGTPPVTPPICPRP